MVSSTMKSAVDTRLGTSTSLPSTHYCEQAVFVLLGTRLTSVPSMLHHTNVDRLLALWQAMHPGRPMFTSVHTSKGQFGTAPGTNLTADSPLKPFFAEEGGFLTSNMVSDIRNLGYTYPEIDDWSQTPEDLESYVRAKVNSIYGESASTGDASQTQRRSQRHRYPPPAYSSPARTRQYHVAEVQVNRSEIIRPSTVNLVLEGTIVGRMSLLEMPRTGIASASVPLRDLVVGNRSVAEMDASEAISLLQQKLEMEIRLVRYRRCCLSSVCGR
jgi:tyrosinase